MRSLKDSGVCVAPVVLPSLDLDSYPTLLVEALRAYEVEEREESLSPFLWHLVSHLIKLMYCYGVGGGRDL